MSVAYYPLYFNWIEDTQELNDQEKGRLIDAIVLYARGDDWQDRIKGNERYVFPIYQGGIDKARAQSQRKAKAGSVGGKQRAENAKQNQTDSSSTRRTRAKLSGVKKT